ncbi:MAG: PKD domain-containing protein [Promethearchaeota archaeon]
MSDGELTATAIASVTVNNVAPAVSAAADQTTDEGTAMSLDLTTFTDPGILDTHTAVINWGDSTIEAGSVWELAGDGTVSGSHIYAEDGIYTVTLTVTDDDGGADTDTLIVTVNNVAPIADAGTDQTADEGAEVSFSGSCTDPGWFDTQVYSWDFGDGSPATTESDDSTATHVYGDNGVYTVTLTATDDDGGVGTDTLTVTVYNVAPTIEAGDDQVVYSGDTVSFNGSFSDPGLLDTHTIVWDLGDGTSVTDTLTFDHIYLVANTYTVTLTVTDDDGGIGMDTLTVTVQRIPIVIDIKPGCPDNVINPGSNGVTRVAILDDGTFDVTLINLDTVAFGPGKAHPIRYKFQDWDHDGDIDLMLWFRTQDTGIEVGDTSAILDADLTDGRQLRGEDMVQTVPPEHAQATQGVLSSDNKKAKAK